MEYVPQVPCTTSRFFTESVTFAYFFTRSEVLGQMLAQKSCWHRFLKYSSVSCLKFKFFLSDDDLISNNPSWLHLSHSNARRFLTNSNYCQDYTELSSVRLYIIGSTPDISVQQKIQTNLLKTVSQSLLALQAEIKIFLLNVLILSINICIAYSALSSRPLPISSNNPLLLGPQTFYSNSFMSLRKIDLHLLPPLNMFTYSFQLIYGTVAVGKIGLETYAPTVNSGYLALIHTTIIPEQVSPEMIQGFSLPILKNFLLMILSIKQAMSSIICSIVKYFKFLTKEDSTPKGNDYPKQRGSRVIAAPFRQFRIDLMLMQDQGCFALRKGGIFRKMGVVLDKLLRSISISSLCFHTLLSVSLK